MRAASACAWCRVDLAGGTLDIWPLGQLHPGARTVNLAIDVATRATVEPSVDGVFRVVHDDGERWQAESAEALAAVPEAALAGHLAAALALPPSTLALASESPRGGGLGASSALSVAIIAAAEAALGRPPSPAAERAALGRDVEARLMKLPTGMQDHYPALLGGLLEIEYRPGGEAVRRIGADLDVLGEALLVVYSGQSHFSAGANWTVVRRRLDGDPEIVELFDGIASVAAELPEALERGDLARAGELVAREWGFRRRLSPAVSVPAVEEILSIARKEGAWGGKACGAGGGGSVALLAPPESRQRIVERLARAGYEPIRARPADTGVEVQPV